MPLKTNGAKIRELRERQALTLTEFAAQVGYAMNSVYMIEVGRSNGGPKFIRAAARVLGCEIEDITDGPREEPRGEAGLP
ncbi:helix-turn-helix domain-containing protein [Actinoallomurus acaciae]|uniref:Helix-turn-helix domain-containing protein n=1 Tax=Actinoallomurus acaciae TaxID=502577 RepID=A0ABV5YBV7_9ACTN